MPSGPGLLLALQTQHQKIHAGEWNFGQERCGVCTTGCVQNLCGGCISFSAAIMWAPGLLLDYPTGYASRLAYNLYSMSNDQDRFTDLDVTVKTKMLYGASQTLVLMLPQHR
ncbi:hypothetical protein WJX82_009088 [Trebouxia sp. C0006]